MSLNENGMLIARSLWSVVPSYRTFVLEITMVCSLNFAREVLFHHTFVLGEENARMFLKLDVNHDF